MAHRAKIANWNNHRNQVRENKEKKQLELEKRDAACGFKRSAKLGEKLLSQLSDDNKLDAPLTES